MPTGITFSHLNHKWNQIENSNRIILAMFDWLEKVEVQHQSFIPWKTQKRISMIILKILPYLATVDIREGSLCLWLVSPFFATFWDSFLLKNPFKFLNYLAVIVIITWIKLILTIFQFHFFNQLCITGFPLPSGYECV